MVARFAETEIKIVIIIIIIVFVHVILHGKTSIILSHFRHKLFLNQHGENVFKIDWFKVLNVKLTYT